MTKTTRTFLIGVVAAVVVVLIAWAAMRQPPRPAPAPAPSSAAGEPELTSIPRTPLATAKQEIDQGSVVVIDVRDADSYVAAHIPGSLQIPLARIEGEINYLPRGKPILTYCT